MFNFAVSTEHETKTRLRVMYANVADYAGRLN